MHPGGTLLTAHAPMSMPLADFASPRALAGVDPGNPSAGTHVRRGDVGAERTLVENYRAHVTRLLARTLGPVHEVEDLAQEVFFRVFRKLHTVSPPEALPGFVTGVTINVAREALRKRRRARWLKFLGSETLDEVPVADEPSGQVLAFYRAVASLSPDHQLFLTLRYVEGMGLSEVAAATGVSLATTKRRLRDAEVAFEKTMGGPTRCTEGS